MHTKYFRDKKYGYYFINWAEMRELAFGSHDAEADTVEVLCCSTPSTMNL
jgi:hypothetical protein